MITSPLFNYIPFVLSYDKNKRQDKMNGKEMETKALFFYMLIRLFNITSHISIYLEEIQHIEHSVIATE